MHAPTQDTTSQQQSSSENNPSFESKGIIKALSLSQNTVTIQHEPIPALNWPTMTMPFHVESDVNLNQFKIGEKISFTLHKSNNEQVIITSIRIINKKGESHGNKKH